MDYHLSPYSLENVPFRSVRCRPKDATRPSFDKVSAWADLIRTCDHEPREEFNFGVLIRLEKGQIAAPVSLLSSRWNWSTQAVRTFLTSLEKCGLIEVIRPNHGRCSNILSIRNFDAQRAKSAATVATFNPTLLKPKKPGWREAMPGTHRPDVWNKTGGLCTYCLVELTPESGRSNSYHIDHVMPVSKGGQNDISNLTPACQSCNSKKNNKSLIEFVTLLVREGGKWAA